MTEKWYKATTSFVTPLKAGGTATYVHNDVYLLDLKKFSNKSVERLFVLADDPLLTQVEKATASPGELRTNPAKRAARKKPILVDGEGVKSLKEPAPKVSADEL